MDPAREYPTGSRTGAIAVLAAILLGALALRLWGIRQGLPYAYNVDENAHFVPRAIGLFGHSANPHYFVNPPALTYLLHAVFAVRFGGGDGAARAFATDPGAVFLSARVVSALLGVLAVWLIYVAGARLESGAVGLVAAAILASAFLPTFYSHLALNDAPALAPLALALVGASGVLRGGGRRDYLLAGAGVGLAAATKYTAGIAALAVLAAALCAHGPGRRALAGLGTAGALALLTFLAANPYALIDAGDFLRGVAHQSAASSQGKLGMDEDSGHRYYLWTLTWGLGWAPALAALGGAVWMARARPRAALVLVPAPLVFIAFMGAQERFFGRWVMPVLPFLCLLAAWAGVRAATALAARFGVPRAAAVAAGGVALAAQGLVLSIHSDRVLSRPDTRAQTRAWLLAHVPPGAGLVVEPVVTDPWLQDDRRPQAAARGGRRWRDLDTVSASPLARRKTYHGVSLLRLARPPGVAGDDGYERSLTPDLVGAYERTGRCWVVTGSTQEGRALAEPDRVPGAIAYYRRLREAADVVYRASPFGAGARPVRFNFDLSFDYAPLAYRRGGPVMTVYRLRGGRCTTPGAPRAATRGDVS